MNRLVTFSPSDAMRQMLDDLMPLYDNNRSDVINAAIMLLHARHFRTGARRSSLELMDFAEQLRLLQVAR